MGVAYNQRFVRNGIAMPNPESVAHQLWTRFMSVYLTNNGQLQETTIINDAHRAGFNLTNSKHEYRNWRRHFAF